MELLKLNKKSEVVPNAAALTIKEFKNIWERDTTEDKRNALKELAFVFFTADFNSIYQAYPVEERDAAIKTDIFENPEYIVDPVLTQAIKKYEELQVTPSMRLVSSARRALEEMINFLKTVNIKEKDKMGKPIYKPRDIMMAMSKTATVVDSLDKLEEKVKKELKDSGTIRGGNEKGFFEDPDE